MHFLHTPFAAPDMLGVLPDDVRAELLDGMAGYSACGFHCHQWEAAFLACYAAAAGRDGARRDGEAPPTFVAPLGPDAGLLEEEAASPDCVAAAAALRDEAGGRRIIARTDRMEPSKNIVRGMLAFEELLTAYPEWRGEVVHVALAYPSRQGLAEYLAYGADVEHTAARINHAFGTDGWTPIVLSVEDDRARSLAALTLSDVLLVNPVRDGLNLVAKEGPLLNTADGVLVLSHQAGAWEELALDGGGALGVNPFDVAGTADALQAALTMDGPARAARGRGVARRGARAHGGRLVGRSAGGRSALSRRAGRGGVGGGAGQVTQQRHGAGGTRHRQVRGGGHRRRALGVDDGHAHDQAGRSLASPQRLERGEGGEVAHVVTEGRQHPQRLGPLPLVVLGHERTHDGALVHVERWAQLALEPARMHLEASRRVLAFGEGLHPVLVLGRTAEVQRHGQALRLDIDALGRRGLSLGHHFVYDRGPGFVRGSLERTLQAVEADQRDAGGRMEDVGQEGGGPARDHRDESEDSGELGQQGRHAGEGARARRIDDHGREGPVEIEEQCAALRLGGQWLQERRQARRGVARRGQCQEAVVVVVDADAARSAPMTTTTSTPVMPLTGVAAETGSTWEGCTPIVVAMDAACSFWPDT